MGTTLTGTTPQDTYDSLIKVTDNGPLSGTLKKLTDGLGNDSSLSLSTTAASFSGNVNALGSLNGFAGATQNLLVDWSSSSQMTTLTNTELFFGTNANRRLTITAAGLVGIGVSDPNGTLTVKNSGTNTRLEFATEASGVSILGYDRNALAYKELYLRGSVIQLNPNDSNRVTVTPDGLTFNGDTAAANALDDYEEGTWTMGVSFGGASVGVTTSANAGTYTKVGRQVTVNGYLELTSKGSSSGVAKITGLPFTIPNLTQNFSAAALYFGDIAFINQFQGYGIVNTTTIQLDEITTLGAQSSLSDTDFANNSRLMVNLTYFVS